MSISAQVMTGISAWGGAVVAYVAGVYITLGKPTEAYAASLEGRLRYDVGPAILLLIALGLLIAGACLFGHAAYRKFSRHV